MLVDREVGERETEVSLSIRTQKKVNSRGFKRIRNGGGETRNWRDNTPSPTYNSGVRPTIEEIGGSQHSNPESRKVIK